MAIFTSKDLPNVRPVADFNFAATKTLDRRITFSRNSIGTYYDELGVVRYASNNVPRFDHDLSTGKCLGLLVEESRTNKFTRSTTIGGTGWTQQGTAIDYITNTTEVAAPDGTFTALKWNPSSIPQYLYQNLSNIGTTQSTMSVWVRCPAGESRTFFMNLYSPSQNNGAGAFTATDQWQRFTWTFTPQSQANVYPIVPDSAGIYYIWGPQLEEGAFATSYIPTSESTVTRAQDQTIIKKENFTKVFDTGFNSFSALVDYDNLSTSDGPVFDILTWWGESTGYTDRISISKDNASPYHVETRAFGSNAAIFNNGNLSGASKAAVQKLAFSWNVPSYSSSTGKAWKFSFSGADVVSPTLSVTQGLPALTRMGIGINPTRLTEAAGRTFFKRVAIYNQVLSEEELKSISAV